MNDQLVQVIFYVFAALALASSFMVISQNNPVRCVLFLVLAFFAASGLWILAEAEFLALILVLVYVGAVMTLFLFVVMMLNIDIESMKHNFMRYIPFGLILVALLTGLLMVAIPIGLFNTPTEQQITTTVNGSELFENTNEQAPNTGPKISNTEALGMVLYTDYLLAFELAAVILLVAIVSAITLVHRKIVRSKQQNIVQQIMTRSEDRVQLISMKSEK
jgi:NADH-quinone oxidoreductase subunit J